MKLRVGDKVKVTAGKDKGREGTVTKVLPKENAVLVEGLNVYTKHIKPMPMAGRSGDRVQRSRPLPVANVAIINDKGDVDRVGYSVGKDGVKTRIFRKTGEAVPYEVPKEETE